MPAVEIYQIEKADQKDRVGCMERTATKKFELYSRLQVYKKKLTELQNGKNAPQRGVN